MEIFVTPGLRCSLEVTLGHLSENRTEEYARYPEPQGKDTFTDNIKTTQKNLYKLLLLYLLLPFVLYRNENRKLGFASITTIIKRLQLYFS